MNAGNFEVRGMTAFGSGSAARDGLRVDVEIKGFNHRFLDVRLKLPPEAAGSEATLRSRLQGAVRRGRVEATAVVQSANGGPRVEVQEALAAQYLRSVRALKQRHRLRGALPLASLLTLPGVLQISSTERPDALRVGPLVEEAFDAALRAFESGRRSEGERLSVDLRARLDDIARDTATVAAEAARQPEQMAARLRQRLQVLLGDATIDAGRLAQEVALMADRVDVSEELVRLRGYLEQARRLLSGEEGPVGKMLDFVMQEMNREANTVASKGETLPVCQAALRVRSAVEAIREQTQNLE
jgi:uncharacterized protein (TIGR00255 family)